MNRLLREVKNLLSEGLPIYLSVSVSPDTIVYLPVDKIRVAKTNRVPSVICLEGGAEVSVTPHNPPNLVVHTLEGYPPIIVNHKLNVITIKATNYPKVFAIPVPFEKILESEMKPCLYEGLVSRFKVSEEGETIWLDIMGMTPIEYNNELKHSEELIVFDTISMKKNSSFKIVTNG